MSTGRPADLVVRAAAVRTMDQIAGPVTALAVRDGMITATAGPDGAAGLLAAWRGPPATATLAPGAPADLVAYPADPFTCPDGQLLELAPAATVIGGRIAYAGR